MPGDADHRMFIGLNEHGVGPAVPVPLLPFMTNPYPALIDGRMVGCLNKCVELTQGDFKPGNGKRQKAP